MDSRQWREAPRLDLRRQNLPPAYIERLIEELSDHSIDLQTENPSMDAQNAFDCLGNTNKIAAVAGHEFRSRTFASRHPWLTFVAGPILFTPLIFALSLLLMAIILFTVGMVVKLVAGEAFSDHSLWPGFGLAIGRFCNALLRFAPFAIAAWIYCRLAKRCGRDRWAAVACGIIAALAGTMISKVTPANDGVHSGCWILGIATELNLRQLLQVLPPLAIAAGLLLRLPTSLPRPNLAPKASAT